MPWRGVTGAMGLHQELKLGPAFGFVLVCVPELLGGREPRSRERKGKQEKDKKWEKFQT
jgi:hypothetical protein